MPPVHRYTEHRWPFDPVVRYFGTQVNIAAITGYTFRSVNRWKMGGIPTSMADEIAVHHMGVHPCEVWPDWFDVAEQEFATRPLTENMRRALARLDQGKEVNADTLAKLRRAGLTD